MNRKLNTREIGKLLDRSAAQLDQDTLTKLASARRTALQYQQTTQHAPALAWLTEHGLIHNHSSSHRKVVNLGIAAVLAALLLGGMVYWQHTHEHDHSDIDIAILTDDLPVDMFVD